MNRRILSFVVILLLIWGGCSLFSSCQKVKYQSGRDTVVSFGDGTYQIVRVPNPPESDNSQPTYTFSLCNLDTQGDIEDNVIEYLQIKPIIYIFGEQGYTMVNYETGEIIQKKALKDLLVKYQEVFKKEKSFTRLQK